MHTYVCVLTLTCPCAQQDGKTPMETLYAWQNGAKSLLFNFSEERAELSEKMM